jgi:hypothetical protein
MLERGNLVPHFSVTTVEGETVLYATIWQRRNLVLITLPAAGGEASDDYVRAVTAERTAFSDLEAECVITRDAIAGLGNPGVIIADRWGEIIYLSSELEVSNLPAPNELLEWLSFVQRQCPECQGETR